MKRAAKDCQRVAWTGCGVGAASTTGVDDEGGDAARTGYDSACGDDVGSLIASFTSRGVCIVWPVADSAAACCSSFRRFSHASSFTVNHSRPARTTAGRANTKNM